MLQRTTPESVGIPSSAVNRFIDSLAELDSVHSFMLLRHGKVAAELWNAPYRPEVPHELFSLSKSFTSVAIGFARQEGKLQLDDKIAEFFREKLPADPDPRFLRMTVRHLLTMSSGHDRCALCYMINQQEPDFVRSFFRSPLVYEPGSRFVYNSGATYMLSALIRRLTGENLTDYLRPRLFEPLGFGEREWEKDPEGTELGGWGFHLTTEEIARFSQLLLDGGRWEGKQILPADYLAQATAFQIDNSMNTQPDWKVGYGFQFWRCRHNAFRGDGAFGQYALVMPDQDAALAVTSGMRNMQSVLDRVWDILLPAMQEAPLPEAPAEQQALRARCACAAFPVLPGPGRELVLEAASFEANAPRRRGAPDRIDVEFLPPHTAPERAGRAARSRIRPTDRQPYPLRLLTAPPDGGERRLARRRHARSARTSLRDPLPAADSDPARRKAGDLRTNCQSALFRPAGVAPAPGRGAKPVRGYFPSRLRRIACRARAS